MRKLALGFLFLFALANAQGIRAQERITPSLSIFPVGATGAAPAIVKNDPGAQQQICQEYLTSKGPQYGYDLVSTMQLQSSYVSGDRPGADPYDTPGLIWWKCNAYLPPINTNFTFALIAATCPSDFMMGSYHMGSGDKFCPLPLPRSSASECRRGDPVALSTGVQYEGADDYLGYGQAPLRLRRYFTSSPLVEGLSSAFLSRWRHNWEQALFFSVDASGSKIAKAIMDDGDVLIFHKSSDLWIPEEGHDTLSEVSDSGAVQYVLVRKRENQVLTFNTAGKPLKLTKAGEGTYSYIYEPILPVPNAPTRLASISNPFGREIKFVYASSRLVEVLLPGGDRISYGYDTRGNLSTFSWGGTRTVQYLYEDTRDPGVLTGIVGEAGARKNTFVFDDQGRSIAATDHENQSRSISLSYPSPLQRTVTTTDGSQYHFDFSPRGDVLFNVGVSADCQLCGESAKSTTYNADGTINVATLHDGTEIKYSYDQQGREVTRKSQNGNTFSLLTIDWHPEFHLPLRVAFPYKIIEFAYSNSGNTTAIVEYRTDDASGERGFFPQTRSETRRRTWARNSASSTVFTESFDGELASRYELGYNASGDLVGVNTTDESASLSYDTAGRLVRVESGDRAITYVYSAGGLLERLETAGSLVEYFYLADGRLKEVLVNGDPAGEEFAKALVTGEPVRAELATTNPFGRIWWQIKSWFLSLQKLFASTSPIKSAHAVPVGIPLIQRLLGGLLSGVPNPFRSDRNQQDATSELEAAYSQTTQPSTANVPVPLKNSINKESKCEKDDQEECKEQCIQNYAADSAYCESHYIFWGPRGYAVCMNKAQIERDRCWRLCEGKSAD